MAKKRRGWRFSSFLRYPRTTQELRANQERNDPYVRGKRRKLPTAWDDQIIRKQKSWKYLGRDHQYREHCHGYEWHEFPYSWRDAERRMIARNIMDWLERIGCFHETTTRGFRWFGPSWWLKGHCRCCYTQLICDTQSKEFGDWCPNPDCCFLN